MWAAERDAEDGAERGGLARRHRVPAQLLSSARALGLDLRHDLAPAIDAWRRQARGAVAGHLLLETTRQRAASALDAVGITWLPLKGVDLVSRGVFEPAERPCGDLDLLIARDDLEPARAALVAAGFVGLVDGPLQERYLREEGYAWQARDPMGALLELHWRLWGSAPDALPERVLDASLPAPDLGPTARRPRRAHAWLLAAVHLWLDPPPRAAGRFLDLVALAGDLEADEVVDEAVALGLELPVCLAAGVAGGLEFGGLAFEGKDAGDDHPRAVHRAIRDALAPRLRPPEKALLPSGGAGWRGLAHASTSSVALARLASGRSSRHGARALWRRLWPHPGLIEASTAPSAPWWLRRARFQWRRLRG